MLHHRVPLQAAGTALLLLLALPAAAQTSPADEPEVTAPIRNGNPEPAQNGTGTPQAPAPGLWQRPNLLGDLGGLRSALGDYGITLGVVDIEDLFGAVAGGVKHGATLQGLTTATLQVDTGKAFGVAGGTFNVSALQIHGRPLSPYYLDDLQTTSGIEATNSTRLWELWYDQSLNKGAYDFKIGQQSIDQEFIVSKYSALFANTMAGWPLLPSDDLYAGGPAYPLSSLGARIQAKPNSDVTILAGVFDDNPPGRPFNNDPQTLDAGGVKFNLNTGALFIAEIQVAATPFAGLPGTYKLGFWYDTGSFPDQEFDNSGVSLANPASDGVAAMHHDNFSPYAVIDQTVWKPGAKSARGLNAFIRVMGAPDNRNLIDFFANGGLTLTDPLPGRDNDTAGIDLGVGHVSGRDAALDRDQAFFSGGFVPVRGTETLIELTYQAQIVPWLQVQPVAQFIFDPGGGIADPADPSRQLGNEAVVGLRANITF